MPNKTATPSTYLDQDWFNIASDPYGNGLPPQGNSTQMDFAGSQMGPEITASAPEPIPEQSMQLGPTMEAAEAMPGGYQPQEQPEQVSDPNLWWLPLAGAVIGGMLEGTGAAYGGAAQGAKGWAMHEQSKANEAQRLKERDEKLADIEDDRAFKRELAGIKGGAKGWSKLGTYIADDGNAKWLLYNQGTGETKKTDVIAPNEEKAHYPKYKGEAIMEGGKEVLYYVNEENPSQKVKIGEAGKGKEDKDEKKNAYTARKDLRKRIEDRVATKDRRTAMQNARDLFAALESNDNIGATTSITKLIRMFEPGVITTMDRQAYTDLGVLKSIANQISLKEGAGLKKEVKISIYELSNRMLQRLKDTMESELQGYYDTDVKDYTNTWGGEFDSIDQMRSKIYDINLGNVMPNYGEGNKRQGRPAVGKNPSGVQIEQLPDGTEEHYYIYDDGSVDKKPFKTIGKGK